MLAMYRAIWHATARRQVLLIVLSIVLSALAAAPLEIQRNVINHAVAGGTFTVLLWLCLGFLAVTALAAGVKFAVEYLSAILGEAFIREVREEIYDHGIASRAAGRDEPGKGTIVTMISSEAEEIGRFAGESIAMPLVRIGTLVTVVAYIATQSVILGIIVASVVIPQGLIALLTQRRINERVRRRVAALRDGTDRITANALESVDEEVARDFQTIYEARRGIFRIKLGTKFAMNLLNGAGTAAILLIGGHYVTGGRIDVGTIVVALTGLARAVQPWRELVMFYRRASMVLVRWQILEQTFPKRDTEAARPGRPASPSV